MRLYWTQSEIDSEIDDTLKIGKSINSPGLDT